MAKFLQETIAETGFAGSDNEKSAQEFADFFRKVNKYARPSVAAFIVFHLFMLFFFPSRFVSLVNKLLLMIY